MGDFPRAQVGDLSISRMIAGSNWFLGFSHRGPAKSKQIRELQTRERIANVMEAFMEEGVNAVMGVRPESPHFTDAIRDAEQRTGREAFRIGTPTLNTDGTPEADSENARTLDAFAGIGTRICMPHQNTTDKLLNRRTRSIDGMDDILRMIRERGMLTGLSTHMPEAPLYADESGLDVDTYIQIYNAAGFLMQIEIEWVHRMIWKRQKPVMTIKPMAAGRINPLPGLAFVWSTIRECDMVTIGAMTADEAKEDIEISRMLLERRAPDFNLEATRSKASVIEASGA